MVKLLCCAVAAFSPFWARAAELTPEMYGCKTQETGNGLCFQRMLDSVPAGSVVKLAKNGVYYNDMSIASWVINKPLTIIGNGAILKKKAATKKDAQTAVLIIENASNVTLKDIVIDGGDSREYPVDRNGRAISSIKYTRSLAIDYGILVKGGNDINLVNVKIENSLFNIWAVTVKDLNVSGELNYSGQLYPVVGDDLQLGAGIKLSNVNQFYVDVHGMRNTNALVEVEANNHHGAIKCISKEGLSSGLTVLGSSELEVDALLMDGGRVGAQLVQGVQNVTGTIQTYNNKGQALVISNLNDNKMAITSGLNIKLIESGNGDGLKIVKNEHGGEIKEFWIDYNSPNGVGRAHIDKATGGHIVDNTADGLRLTGQNSVSIARAKK